MDEALQHAQTATYQLRELAHGILLSIRTHWGLGAGRGTVIAASIPIR